MLGNTHWLKRIWERLGEIFEEIKCIHKDLLRILRWIALKEIDFVQVGGGMNFSIVRGAGGTFTAVLTPSNGAQAAGSTPSWAASDPSVVVTPSADGLSAVVNAPAGSTVTGFDLSFKATSSDPNVGVLSATHTISVTEPTPPPPPPLTAVDFVQSAG